MIAAALGAIAGLAFFFHGFSLLQQRWPAPVLRPTKSPANTTTTTTLTAATLTAATTEVSAGSGDTSRESRSTRAEVIKLTPHEGNEISSASMTQQGRIAAALLKAGVPSPATWSTEPVHTSVRVDEQSTSRQSSNTESSTASGAEVSRVLQQGATASAFRIPGLDQTTPRHASTWKPTLMIWGGPALTLACIYLLVSRLGWL